MQFGGEISAATLATCLFQWALASCVNFSLIAPECSCLAGMCIRVGNSDHPTGLCINRQSDAESYLQNCLHIRANNGCSHNDFRRVCLELDNIFKSKDRPPVNGTHVKSRHLPAVAFGREAVLVQVTWISAITLSTRRGVDTESLFLRTVRARSIIRRLKQTLRALSSSTATKLRTRRRQSATRIANRDRKWT